MMLDLNKLYRNWRTPKRQTIQQK